MDEQIFFTTNSTGSVANVHSSGQTNLRQCTSSSKNSAVLINDEYLFVAQAQKALIHVYNVSGSQKRESVEQRLPLPEVVNCLEVIRSNGTGDGIPYVLIASTPSAKIYIWELSSGLLLSVKPMAHYQSITKIKSILNGKYVITSGNDCRVILWQTMDLINQEDPKPIAILHDHTLPVTDFQVSATYGEHLSCSGIRLYTASQDATVKCYDLSFAATSNSIKSQRNAKTGSTAAQPKLLATFTLPQGVTSLAIDPADRNIYIGTSTACYSLPLYYAVGAKRFINLIQMSHERSNTKGKIFSIVEQDSSEEESFKKREELLAMGQLVVTKIAEVSAECLQTSLDGSLLLAGDSMGKLLIFEVFSKQILRTIQPLTTQQTSLGSVTNIILSLMNTQESDDITKIKTNNKTAQKFPTLQRAIFDTKSSANDHNIWHQVSEIQSDTTNLSINHFDDYIDHLASQESVFFTNEAAKINTTTKPKQEVKSVQDSQASPADSTSLEAITNAYKDLREMYETLYQEHEELKKRS